MDEPEWLQIAEDALRAGDEIGVWSAVREMEAIDHGEPPVVDLKLRAITAFRRFDQPEAQQWADLLSFADDQEEHRITLGEYYWHRAAWHMQRDEIKEAGRSVKQASLVWREIWWLMWKDERLRRLF